MPGTTTRLAIPYPLASEPPDGPTQMQALANALDNAAIDLAEGLLSARPAPSIRGRWYYATDNGVLYRDSGSTWRIVGLAENIVTAVHIAANTITNAQVSTSAAIAESKLALASDAAAGTASRRTLGAGATQACAGNDARLSDQRVPTDGSVTAAKLAAAVAQAIYSPGDYKHVAYAVAAGSEPTGWLLCDGRAVSRTTYAALFAKIGTLHGVGDGSTTFNLPDAQGRGIVGRGPHIDVDTVGKNDGVAAASRRPRHAHTVNAHSHVVNDHTHVFDQTIGLNSGKIIVRHPNSGINGQHHSHNTGAILAIDLNTQFITQSIPVENWRAGTFGATPGTSNSSPGTDTQGPSFLVGNILVKT